MSRYRTPDYLICLGEGGTEIGETFIQQEWILEEVLSSDPREDVSAPDENERPLHAFFIDTDSSTMSDDIESDVESQVQEITQSQDNIDHPAVDATVINVADGPHKRYLQRDQVTAPSTIRDLAEDKNIKSWWLRDEGGGNILGPLDGLTTRGVDRMRGLTRAIDLISQWKDDPLGDLVEEIKKSNYDEPNVAVVVGIGGGTGSGLYLHLARRIAEVGATVTLFGILPTPSGRDEDSVLMNAYAALSELEYLALTDQNHFRNIVLLPYDPAVDDAVFDKAVTYSITSFYNLSLSQSNTYNSFDEDYDPDGPPQFAPFTVGSTRYLHYLQEDIKNTRKNFINYLDDKESALNAEEKLYESLEDFIEENYDYAEENLYITEGEPTVRLESTSALDLSERLSGIKNLLDQPFMKDIEYWSAGNLSDAFGDIKSTSEDRATWEDESDKEAAVARDFITRLATNSGPVSKYKPAEDGWSSDERRFIKRVLKEFELVARRAGIIRAKNAIDSEEHGNKSEEEVATDIEKAIDEDDSGHGAEVESYISKLNSEISDLESDIEALSDIVSDAEKHVSSEEQNDSGKNLTSRWGENVEKPVEEYYKLASKKEKIDSLLTELESKVADELGLGSIRESDNISVTGTTFDRYSRLNELLEDVGCETVSKTDIEESVKAAKRARKKQLIAQERDGTLRETLFSLIGRGTIGGLQNDYQVARDDAKSYIVDISRWNEQFEASVVKEYFSDRTSSLESREKTLLNEIGEATDEVIKDATKLRSDAETFLSDDDGHTREVFDRVEFDDVDADRSTVTAYLDDEEHNLIDQASTGQELLTLLQSGPIEQLLSSILVDPFETYRSEREDHLANKKNVLSSYDTLKKHVTEEGSEYTSKDDKVDEVSSIATFEDEENPDPFKKSVRPRSRGKIGNGGLAEANLWSDPEEREKLIKDLKESVPQVPSEYVPISKKYISDNDTKQVDYDGHRLASAFMSPLFQEAKDDQAADIGEVSNELINNRPFHRNDYLVGRGAFADTHDFAITTFVGGVFLDNLRIFTNECRDAYLNGTDIEPGADRYNPQDDVPSIVKHHTYGLDGVVFQDEEQFIPEGSDGGLCYRRDVLNFDADGTEVLLDQSETPTQNEQGVVETLLEEYHEVVGYPSTIDLE
jgi:hypothetical protein